LSVLYADLTEPSEALALARDMSARCRAAAIWPAARAAQDRDEARETLIDGGQFTEAVALLDTTAKPSGNHGTTWTLLKAEAAAGSASPAAYDTLIESAAASPDGRVDAALAKYATALAKTNRDVDAHVWKMRDARAMPAAPFTLPSLRDGAPVRLADFRGASCCWRSGIPREQAAVRSFLTCSRCRSVSRPRLPCLRSSRAGAARPGSAP